jgi:hypothetical protein
MKISLNVQSVLTKALFATVVAGSAVAVGCDNRDAADGAPSVGESTQALMRATPDRGALGEARKAPRKGALDEARLAAASPNARLSAVSCTGHQDQGGRICCDETHCCINIGGTINCDLPPRNPKIQQTMKAQ